MSCVLQLKSWHGAPRRDLFECNPHTVADRECCVRTIEETPDEAYIGLRVERYIDQDERKQLLEPGKERLTEHDPRADRAASAHRLEGIGRSGILAQGADHVWRMGQPVAARAAGKNEHVAGRC
jgi:hypothetical protein